MTKIGEVTDHRFKTRKFGVTVYQKQFTDRRGVKVFARSWSYSKMVNGKTAVFPLGFNKAKAEKLAEEIAAYLSIQTNTLDMAIATYNPRVAVRANHVPTFQEIIDAYEKALNIIGRRGSRVGAGSFKGYKSSLFTMLRKVDAHRRGKPFESYTGRHHVDYEPWFGKPVDILTTKFAMDFKLASLPSDEDADEDDLLTAKISADTTLRCARALFSKQALRYYKEIGLNLPDISGFMSEPDYGAKKYFELLPPDVIVNVMRASIELRIADLDAYRAFVLCMHCGLRRAEAIAFKPHWLRLEDRPMINVVAGGGFCPKHGHGRRVMIERWVFDLLTEVGPVQSEKSLDRLNDWMKGLIPKEFAVNKANHELRKLFISWKAKTEGIHAAATQAGHSDVKVTTTHYADSTMPERLLPLWKEETGAAILKFNVA